MDMILADAAGNNTIILGLIGLAGTLGGAWLAHKQQQIHVLVNSNMTTLRNELSQVADELKTVTAERDKAEGTVAEVADAAKATSVALASVEEQQAR